MTMGFVVKKLKKKTMRRIKETDLLQTFYRLMINQEGEKKPVNYTVFFMYTTFSYLNLSVEKTIKSRT